MKRVLKILLICLLGLGPLILTSAAPAQKIDVEQTYKLPPSFQKSWVWPRCERVKRLNLFTDRFVLQATRLSNLLYRPENIYRVGSVYRVQQTPLIPVSISSTGYAPFFDLKLADQGKRLMYYKPMIFMREDAPDPFAANLADNYYQCPIIESRWPSFDNAGLEAMPLLDEVDSICGTVPIGRSSACQRAVFNAFDTNASTDLSSGEIARAYRQITYLSASLGCPLRAYFPGNTGELGPQLAADMFDRADKNKDQKLSFDEMQAAWETIETLKGYQALKPLLDNLSTLLPFLPPGPTLPDCSCAG